MGTDLKNEPLLPEEAEWLIQFINNCRSAGVLWQAGQRSSGDHVVKFIAGEHTFVGQPAARLDQAVRFALDELIKATRTGIG